MRVILLKDVKGIGRQNEIKDLSDGYVKNFLIPRGLGRPATESAVKDIKTKVESSVKHLDELKEQLRELEHSTKTKPLIFKIKTGEHKETFGSITSEEIVKMFEFHGLKDAKLETYHPIKALGRHVVKVNLGKGIKGDLTLELQPLQP